jgi:putative lipase involved disintegration of autophagic bodies
MLSVLTASVPTLTTTFRRCHLGKVIVYDTVTKLGWSVNIANHAIKVVVEKILHEDWDKENEVEVPALSYEEDCVVRLHIFALRLVV